MEYLDQHIFEEIYESQFKRVFNYISYRINNHMDTEDLVSQVFYKVIDKYESFNPLRASMSTWIISIARNTVTDYFRAEQKDMSLELDSVEPYLPSGECPDEILVKREENLVLMNALNTLSARDRNLIALKYGAELTNREIAEVMELSESNVGVIVHRSLEKLRVYIEKEETACIEISKTGRTRCISISALNPKKGIQ